MELGEALREARLSSTGFEHWLGLGMCTIRKESLQLILAELDRRTLEWTDMGRKALTAEQRTEAMEEDLRVELLVSAAGVRQTEDAHDVAESRMDSAISAALEAGNSLRDVAAVLGVPHTTVHARVKPYIRPA